MISVCSSSQDLLCLEEGEGVVQSLLPHQYSTETELEEKKETENLKMCQVSEKKEGNEKSVF